MRFQLSSEQKRPTENADGSDLNNLDSKLRNLQGVIIENILLNCPNLLVKLNPNKAADVDSIPDRLLKFVANELANPVSWLFDLSFSRAILPQLRRQANNSPVYTDGDTDSVTNYRGIS